MARELGRRATRVVRLDAFATNAVYEVDAGGSRFIVKASTLHDAIRAEAWACARGADAGCAAPAILALGRLGADDAMTALIMERVEGRPIAAGHPLLRDVGVGLRRLHEVKLERFGALADASWDERGGFALAQASWLDFLRRIVHDTRALAKSHAEAGPVADAAAAALDTHADAFAGVVRGSLCHGDLKLAHVLVDVDRLAGVIDWGDAAVGDPLWDVARFAHRADAQSLSLLLEGYDPDRATVDDLAWRAPLYGALWMLVDAIVDHRLGRRADAPLAAATKYLARQAD